MVVYTPTPADLEAAVGLKEEEKKTVVVVEKRSHTAWMWKVSAGLLVAALCLGLVLLFAWYWHGRAESTTPSAGPTQALVADDDNSDPHNTLKRISSKAKAAIHLEGIHEEGDSEKAQLQWRNGQGQAFAQGGLTLLNNEIVVPQTGLYFVYSQASFRVSCSDNSGEEGLEPGAASSGKRLVPLSHRVWRYSDSVGRKASLMSAVRSACQHSISAEEEQRTKQGWYNALYLGAVFQLNKDDRLWTETNQLSELETDGGKTFFGVFAL
ncbi:tumor necrosis factor b (TNF superfamily, member 2) [Hippocampus zosterae]|uniref:tumor necrosis factor b (TNF superfamily, member 2) n=1 Tax=Hippocampus zosterae TaxID=109293 RepID=UPI00223E10F8|nr:tumor necrosis factor b (TNF superfamily, member 2) [Hippocampus zosterae]